MGLPPEQGCGYTARMDPVRFGRALGLGARHAVKTVATAVDAASAENPAVKSPPGAGIRSAPPQVIRSPEPRQAQAAAANVAAKAREANRGVRRGSKQFGKAVWNPFVRLSGVLWLEVTGLFFGIVAAFAASGVWKARAEVYPHAASHAHLVTAVAMTAAFSYFCVSSFVRARRRERRR